MTVQVQPDLMGTMIARLRSFAEITALVGTTPPRVSAEFQRDWPMPCKAVRVRASGGPRGDVSVNILQSRLDVFCYGETGFEANRLKRTVYPALCPDQSGIASFVLAHTRVYDIRPEAEGISDTDLSTGWPFCWFPVIVTWGGIAV